MAPVFTHLRRAVATTFKKIRGAGELLRVSYTVKLPNLFREKPDVANVDIGIKVGMRA